MSSFDNAKNQPKSEEFVKNIDAMNDELKVMEEARESGKQFYLRGDHDEGEPMDVDTGSVADFNHTYRVNPGVKQKPELRDQKILLSVRHLKQFFFLLFIGDDALYHLMMPINDSNNFLFITIVSCSCKISRAYQFVC